MGSSTVFLLGNIAFYVAIAALFVIFVVKKRRQMKLPSKTDTINNQNKPGSTNDQ